MKYLTLLVLAFLASGRAALAQTDQELAKVPLELYMQAHATGTAAPLRQAFYPSARIQGIRDGKLIDWTLEEYAALFKGRPAVDENKRVRKIDSLEVNGNAAVARLTLDYPAARFTDYILLLKLDGEWKIMSKIFTTLRK